MAELQEARAWLANFSTKFWHEAALSQIDQFEQVAAGVAQRPLPTVTTHDRFALVTVAGTQHRITDIMTRHLTPRELASAQGFPSDYVLEAEVDGKKLSRSAQVRMIGNSVCPPVAAAVVRANVTTRSVA